MPHGFVEITADIDALGGSHAIAAEARALGVDLEDITASLGGNVTLAVKVGGTWDHPRGDATLRGEALRLGGVVLGRADADVRADGRTAHLEKLVVTLAQGGRVEARGQIGLGADDALCLDAKAQDMPAASVAGMLGSPARLDGLLDADVQARGTPARPEATAHVQGRRLKLDALPCGDLRASVQGTGALWHLRATLQKIADAPLFAEADVRLDTDTQTLQGEVNGGMSLGAATRLAALPLPLEGEFQFATRASGSWAAPTFAAEVTGGALQVHGRALGHGDTTLRLACDPKTGTRLRASIPGLLRAAVDGHLRALGQGKNTLRLRGDLEGEALEVLVPTLAAAGANLSIGAAISGDWNLDTESWPRGSVTLERLALRTPHDTVTLQAPATLGLRGNALRLSRLALAGSQTKLQAQGTLADLAGATSIDAALDADVDLALAALLMPGLGHAEGTLAASVQLEGLLRAPRWRGEAHVGRPVALRPRGNIAEVQLEKGTVRLHEGRVQLRDVRGSIGPGSFEASGSMRLDAAGPGDYDIVLTAHDLPLRTQELLLETRLKLALVGPGPLPLVRGAIDVTSGRFSKHFAIKDYYFMATRPSLDAPLAQTAPWLKDLRLDLRVSTQSNIAAKIDGGAFAVALDVGANVHVTGNALQPHVDGKIGAEHGSLRFPQATLRVSSAAIDFLPTRRGKLDAAVHLQADGEVLPASSPSDPDPRPYQVNLSLDGSLDKMALELHAAQLSRLEVLALLATGHANLLEMTNGEGEANRMDAALAFAGSQLAEPLANVAEAQLEKALNLKVALGAELSDESVKVTAAKQMHKRLRLEGSYARALSGQGSAVGSRARLNVTDRLLLEGAAQQDVGGQGGDGPQSSFSLKWRLVGQ